MTMGVIPFPKPHPGRHGTVCVMGDKIDGFQVAHESSSGNSWGSFSGPYPTGWAAIAAAYTLNRDTYGGVCDISICDAALADQAPDARPPSNPGEF